MKNKLKNEQVQIIVGVIILAVIVFFIWSSQQSEKEKSCLEKIYYYKNVGYSMSNSKINAVKNGRNFGTQNEAMNYCLKVLD